MSGNLTQGQSGAALELGIEVMLSTLAKAAKAGGAAVQLAAKAVETYQEADERLDGKLPETQSFLAKNAYWDAKGGSVAFVGPPRREFKTEVVWWLDRSTGKIVGSAKGVTAKAVSAAGAMQDTSEEISFEISFSRNVTRDSEGRIEIFIEVE